MKKIINICSFLFLIIILMSCSQSGNLGNQSNSPVKIYPFLEDGQKTWTLAGTGGVFDGKYLRFKLTNTSSEDYLVQFTLTTKGKTQDSDGSAPRDYVFQIPNIIAPAYAKTENEFSCMAYNRNGYWIKNEVQFFGKNYDGSCLAESVTISNVMIVKASEHPERIKQYKLNDGKLAYDTQAALPKDS